VVASKLGEYLRNSGTVRPGRGGMNPFVKAAIRVDIAGENIAAWWKAIMFAGVHVVPMVGTAAPIISGAASGGSCTFRAHKSCGVAGHMMLSPSGQ
jgi:hypothetical protein